jgi:hypothetical protein
MDVGAPTNYHLATMWDTAERGEVVRFLKDRQTDSAVARWVAQHVEANHVPLHRPDELLATVIVLCDEVTRLRERVEELEKARA